MNRARIKDDAARIVVLDDDPTGTQAAENVPVVFDYSVACLRETLHANPACYVQTNTRAMSQASAVALVRDVRAAAIEACDSLGVRARFVLRGDSTLRGHIFAETDVFCRPDSVILFAPAFPAGGRTTVEGVQRVRVDGRDVDAVDTEFARDPVFGYRSRTMRDYVAEIGAGRLTRIVPLSRLRAGGPDILARELISAPAGAVVVPDSVTNDDVGVVFNGLVAAWKQGRDVVVRGAAPIAALCAGALSDGLLSAPPEGVAGPVLVACGSHTAATTEQLVQLANAGHRLVSIDTDKALSDPRSEILRVSRVAARSPLRTGVVVIATGRDRRTEHGTLAHGASVMKVLTGVVASVADEFGTVVAKGGITSAAVATDGLGARRAWVRGQLLPGVSLWDLESRLGNLPYAVVPGNVGGADTLIRLLDLLGLTR